MRKLLGGAAVVAGFGVLGYVGTTNHAERMEQEITDLAGDVSGTAVLPVDARVSGRDVTVTGQAMDQAELDALRGAYEQIEGVRVVNVDGVALLPVADPFEITLSKDIGGDVSASGSVPSYTAQAGLGAVAADLPLAAGAPDGWGASAMAGQIALGALNSGQMVLSGTELTLSGVADTPAQVALAEEALANLPDGFTSDVQIDVLDDGRPLRVTLAVDEGAVTGSAKLPSELEGDASFTDLQVVQSPLGAEDPTWPEAAQTVRAAADQLIEGDVSLEGAQLIVRGQASPEGKAAAEAAFAALPESFEQDVDIVLWDDGLPLSVAMGWDGTQATADGKLPADFTLNGPAGTAVEPTGTVSFRPDAAGAFTANAEAGVAALGLLNAGEMTATAETLTLTGTATSPQVGASIDDILVNAAAGTDVSTDFTYLDDGSPASWVLSYDAEAGGAIEGRLPTTLDADSLAAAAGIAELDGSVSTALEDSDTGNAPEILGTVSEYLPEIDGFTLTRDGAGTALDIVAAPGVDVDLMAADLAERLPGDTAFSIIENTEAPGQGTYRVNAATGLGEVFLNGFWIPDLDFVTSVEGCNEQTALQMEAGITFLSGSARLDAKSVRVINALAAIAVPCVEADLELEVAGHTDASGDADFNQTLSEQRAAAVREALIARGVTERAITSIGFGQTQPIADNETPEGRAENRRTEIEWFERGAQRNP